MPLTTKIRGTQIKEETITNDQLSPNANIGLSKLEKEVISADGTQELTNDWNLGNSKTITGVPDPINDTDVANKQWVEDLLVSPVIDQKEKFIATEGQTVFTLSHNPINNTLLLYYNGLLLDEGALDDYTIVNEVITLNFPCIINDKIIAKYKYI